MSLNQKLLKVVVTGILLCGASSINAQDTAVIPDEKIAIVATPKTPEEGLNRLIEGNKRYAADTAACYNRNQERRIALYSKQFPFAVIMGCSDSRVSPEIVFDQGVGDLFVVRNAGNVVGGIELDSIEYAVHVLNASVIIVLGHENCGAVTAVVNGQGGDIPAVAALISPVLNELKGLPGNKIENAIKLNVKRSVAALKGAKQFSNLIQEKKLIVVGGFYDLHTGLIELL